MSNTKEWKRNMKVWRIAPGSRTSFEEGHPICVKIGEGKQTFRLSTAEADDLCNGLVDALVDEMKHKHGHILHRDAVVSVKPAHT